MIWTYLNDTTAPFPFHDIYKSFASETLRLRHVAKATFSFSPQCDHSPFLLGRFFMGRK